MPYTFFTSHQATQRSTQRGFTLVETIVAIFILALTIGGLLSLTAGGFFAIRYAKNDIVATNLLQESLEYIRNSRDTASQQGMSWEDWLLQYQSNDCDITTNNANGNNDKGCMINPYVRSGDAPIVSCPTGGCSTLNYDSASGFYGYGTNNFYNKSIDMSKIYNTSFVRTIAFTLVTVSGNTDPELVITAKMEWLNGTNPKQVTQSIVLTKWNMQ